ncbi:type I-F CRISPR-associated protein Csy1 [Thioalkalivibrio sp. ALE19]|uniref:type I-F CRISPR-associated protein Csy1 n=1 Tax=Thioalkalivibrio sp. ALE19 TaxID=1266909 RepID=UPI000491B2D8|nr:type I-F CRISPR-associated protein Csy1 [Thioalkalivibrio sp. ALE19]
MERKPKNFAEAQSSEEIEEFIDENLVHFAGKVINSNISPAVGVRLKQEDGISDLPHVCARTLMADPSAGPLRLDWIGIQQCGITFKQIQKIAGEKEDPKTEITFSKPAADAVRSRYLELKDGKGERRVVNGDAVKSRNRQLLVPVQGMETSYVSVTPLYAMGVSAEIQRIMNQRFEQEKEEGRSSEKSALRAVDMVKAFSIGGTRPRNVSGLTDEPGIRQALVFEQMVPKMDSNKKRLIRACFSGFRYRIPRDRMKAYTGFLSRTFPPGGDDSEEAPRIWTKRLKEKEREILMPLIEAIESQAQSLARKLEEQSNELPEIDEAAPGWPWVFPDRRSREWKKQEASSLAKQIHKMDREDKGGTGQVRGQDVARIADALEAML